MSEGVLEALGGVGLFLVGMFVMTDGLRQLAGRSLRGALRRFTRSPRSGAAAGAVSTALIQSSSATTVAAVGFVGAGLMTFGQALGIIFGANLGTTITGWLVAVFGFKIPVGTLAFPIVFGGALGRVFFGGKWASVGQAMAGFGLIFIGIDILQSGLAGLEGSVTPDTFPPNTLFGRVQLVGIGVLITLVTQSSSAGVAIALASVHAGTISFPQAAAIVIGMDIGTTVTAAMAALGGGTQVKRTGLAHVVYNLLTGMAAFVLLVPYLEVMEVMAPGVLGDQPELALVGFHTFFNGLGVLLVLPVADRFAGLIERLVPSRDDEMTESLDDALVGEPDAALDMVARTLRATAQRTVGLLVQAWRNPSSRSRADGELTDLRRAVGVTLEYVMRLDGTDLHPEVRDRHQAAIHLTDHLDRLLRRLGHRERLHLSMTDPDMRDRTLQVMAVAEELEAWLSGAGEAVTARAEVVAEELVSDVRPYRADLIERAGHGLWDPDEVGLRLDAIRWLARIAVHLWRIGFYLERLSEPGDRVSRPRP